MKAKTKIGKRFLSLLLAVLCVISVLPVTALAAASSTITLQDATFFHNYSSASFTGSVGLHKMTMNMGAAGTHVGFCGDHGKTMGTSLRGKTWGNPQPVTDPTIKLMLAYYYTHYEGIFNDVCKAKGFNFTWGQGQYEINMNAWVQAVCWRALGQGKPIGGDVTTAIAEELMYVSNNLNGTHHTDVHKDKTLNNVPYYNVANEIVSNPDAWCDVEVYMYTYTGGPVGSHTPDGVQRMLVGIPKLPPEERNYELTVKKVDATNPTLALPGAEFTLSKTDGTFSATGITGPDGTYKFENLAAGTYAVVETKAPTDYQIDTPEPQYVSIPQNRKVEVVFTDTPEIPPDGDIRKVDKDVPTMGLKGATIKIEGIDNNFVGEYQTGEGGSLPVNWKDLPIGSYKAYETAAPEGYILDPQVKTFEWKNKASVKLVFENDSKVKVKLVKKSSDGKLLPGAVFNILKDGKIIGTEATDANGEILVTGVTEGYYSFVEVEPPTGYEKMKNSVGVHVDAADMKRQETKVVTAVNYERHKIKLIKTDAMTKEPVAGVMFRYWRDNDDLGITKPTGPDGVIEIDNLQSGTYRFVEVQQAPHYAHNPQEYHIYINCEDESQNRVHTIEVVNYHLKKVKLVKFDPEANAPVAGVVFDYWKDGTYVGVTEPTDKNGEILIPDLDTGLYAFKEKSGPFDYTVNPELFNIYVDVKDLSKDIFKLDIANYEKRTMIIEKVDVVTGKRLPGAKFHVTSTDLNYDEHYVTDANGQIILEHVRDGTYIIEEVQAPDGYILPEGAARKQTVVLNPGSENTVTITFKDAPKTCISIYKTDSVTGKPLEGAKFEVSTVAGRIIGYYTTDATGVAYTPRLEPGVYVVKEVMAPDGYELNSTPQNAIVTIDNAELLRFTNVPKTTITITKMDAITGKTLPGATFVVKDANGLCATTEGSYTTGPDGTVTTSPVPTGKYYVYELSAPDGYALNPDPTCVWVVAGEKNNAIVKNVELGSISILKSDTNNKPIAGCVFKVETAEGGYIGQFTTDGSGEAFVPHLKAGTYIVTEIRALEGYEIDKTPQTVVVKDGQTSQVKFTDAKKGGLIVHLQDQKDGSDLPDGKFTITRCADNSIVATGVTDQAGIWMVGNLTPGKYIITHTYAAPGYTIVDTEKTEFVVAGMNKDVYFKDATAGLVVELVDSITNETIKGGRFQVIRNSDNIVIGEYETDMDGLALVSRLIPGMYTVKCIGVPDGYVLKGDESKLTHVKANETAHATFFATPIAGITIHSVDKDTKKPLAGTKFEVWNQNGVLVDTYTTDTTGTIQTNKLAPGHYVVKQIYAENGYTPVTAEMTVEVKTGTSVVYTFESVCTCTMKIVALDQNDKYLSGMKVKVAKQSGEYVGEYITGIDGSVTVNNLASGYYVVTEVEAPDGYTVTTEKQTIQVKTTEPAIVKFEHNAIYGLQIRTSVGQTKTMMAGVKYQITKVSGEVVGTYTSDAQGLIFVTLEPGTYVVTQVSVPNGYTPDSKPRNVIVAANKITVEEFVLTQLSSVRVKFVDGNTNTAIYGVRILVKDSNGAVVGEYTSNNEGYIELTTLLQNGTYTLEMISAPNGYTVDTVPKTVKVLNGETTEIVWKFFQNVGQIQVVLTSSDYNKLTGKPAGSPIQGAEFTIMDADTFAVMDTMTTDVNGVAASHGLPIGRYFIKQSGAAAYYAVCTEQFEQKLKIANDVVRFEVKNSSINLSIGSGLKSNARAVAGTTIRYDVTGINNNSDMSLDNFYWHIKVPTDVARVGTVYTGKWNNTVNYRVEYKTNMTDYTTLATNLLSSNRYQYDLSSTALGLMAGEYVTDVRFVFGTVPAGFKLENKPAVMMYILPLVFNGYKLIGRVEAGGQYNGYWYTGTSLWTTVVQSGYKYGAYGTLGYGNPGMMMSTAGVNHPNILPKTGY